MASDILIVDDEADIREMVAGFLQDDGHRTRLARDSDEALKAVEERRPHLVILDIWLQGSRLDGLEVLNIIKKAHPDLRRLRLHREALQGRSPAAGDAARAGGLQAAAGGTLPA
jgi:DNA-binding NtrC family response regulator